MVASHRRESRDTTIYGLYGTTHGGARVLTLMSGIGTTGLRKKIGLPPDCLLRGEAGNLLQLHEQRRGGFVHLVKQHEIQILDRAQWRDMKQKLGRSVYV